MDKCWRYETPQPDWQANNTQPHRMRNVQLDMEADDKKVSFSGDITIVLLSLSLYWVTWHDTYWMLLYFS